MSVRGGLYFSKVAASRFPISCVLLILWSWLFFSWEVRSIFPPLKHKQSYITASTKNIQRKWLPRLDHKNARHIQVASLGDLLLKQCREKIKAAWRQAHNGRDQDLDLQTQPSFQPTASTNFPAMWMSHLDNRSSSPQLSHHMWQLWREAGHTCWTLTKLQTSEQSKWL